MYEEKNKSMIFSSEKGGAGKTTVLSNLVSFISYRSNETVLVLDGDVTNQSITRQLVPSLTPDHMKYLENMNMLIPSEKLITGLLKDKSFSFYPDDFVNPESFCNYLMSANDPLSEFMLNQFPVKAKNTLSSITNTKIPDELLAEALSDGLNQAASSADFYTPTRFANHEISEETLKLIPEDIENTDPNIIHWKKINRKIIEDVYSDEIIASDTITPESAFSRLSYKAIPIAQIPIQSLFIVPSKGRTRLDYRSNPLEIIEPMNKLNDSLLSVYQHVFYDTEATSNVFKTVLLEMDAIELISIVTPQNLDVELDMLSKFDSKVEICGIILNNAFIDTVEEQVNKINSMGFPLLGVIPFDEHMMTSTLKNKLVIGDASNLDYALRVSALNLVRQNKLDIKTIKNLFTNAESVYNQFAKNTKSTSGKSSTTSHNKKNQEKSNVEDPKASGIISKISNLLNLKVSTNTE